MNSDRSDIPRDPSRHALAANEISRRGFLRATATMGGGLLLGMQIPSGENRAAASEAGPFEPNAFVRIDGDGTVSLTMPYVEMGQGSYTAISMLIAEELEVDLAQVQLLAAPPDEKHYVNPLLGVQATGNSNAVRGAWEPLRRAGAAARMMLVAAAAAEWQVEPASCLARRGEVVHPSTGRTLGYGALAASAARQPVPTEVPLKPQEDFKLIGRSVPRLDVRGKVDGTAVFGIDMRPRG